MSTAGGQRSTLAADGGHRSTVATAEGQRSTLAADGGQRSTVTTAERQRSTDCGSESVSGLTGGGQFSSFTLTTVGAIGGNVRKNTSFGAIDRERCEDTGIGAIDGDGLEDTIIAAIDGEGLEDASIGALDGTGSRGINVNDETDGVRGIGAHSGRGVGAKGERRLSTAGGAYADADSETGDNCSGKRIGTNGETDGNGNGERVDKDDG